MKPANDDLPRWRETAHDPRALGARAADLVDAVRAVPPLPPEALARIEGAVLARRAPPGRGLPVGLRFAVLTLVLLASVATAKGTMMLWRRYVAPTAAAERSLRHRAPPAHPATPARAGVEIEPLPTPAEPPAPAARAVSAAPSHARHTALAAPRAAEVPATTATEAQLLARALGRLRQAHDPAGAVALLDQYARAFPRGVLAPEAASARLEAALAMNDRRTALGLLDARATFPGRLGADQLLTRAELRASTGRYADALGDFDGVLAPKAAAPAADAERALYGRAVCFGHLGRDERARADLTTYRERFPAGPHAAEVARLLAGNVEHRP
jgi:hypothetical protein